MVIVQKGGNGRYGEGGLWRMTVRVARRGIGCDPGLSAGSRLSVVFSYTVRYRVSVCWVLEPAVAWREQPDRLPMMTSGCNPPPRESRYVLEIGAGGDSLEDRSPRGRALCGGGQGASIGSRTKPGWFRVRLVYEVRKDPRGRFRIVRRTNLPDGTELSMSVSRGMFLAQGGTNVRNGTFRST